MKVLGCAAIPIATITMTIAKMHNDGGNVIITDNESPGVDKPFWAPIPKHVAKKLVVGNTVTIVCKPVSSLTFATETFAIKKFTGEKLSEVIYDRDDYSNLFGM